MNASPDALGVAIFWPVAYATHVEHDGHTVRQTHLAARIGVVPNAALSHAGLYRVLWPRQALRPHYFFDCVLLCAIYSNVDLFLHLHVCIYQSTYSSELSLSHKVVCTHMFCSLHLPSTPKPDRHSPEYPH
jgi:hypothetical protein